MNLSFMFWTFIFAAVWACAMVNFQGTELKNEYRQWMLEQRGLPPEPDPLAVLFGKIGFGMFILTGIFVVGVTLMTTGDVDGYGQIDPATESVIGKFMIAYLCGLLIGGGFTAAFRWQFRIL